MSQLRLSQTFVNCHNTRRPWSYAPLLAQSAGCRRVSALLNPGLSSDPVRFNGPWSVALCRSAWALLEDCRNFSRLKEAVRFSWQRLAGGDQRDSPWRQCTGIIFDKSNATYPLGTLLLILAIAGASGLND